MMTSVDFCVYFHFSLSPIPCSEVYLSVRGSQVRWTLNDEVSVQISICNGIDLDDDKWFLLMGRLDELQRLIILKWNYESFTEENQRKEPKSTISQAQILIYLLVYIWQRLFLLVTDSNLVWATNNKALYLIFQVSSATNKPYQTTTLTYTV